MPPTSLHSFCRLRRRGFDGDPTEEDEEKKDGIRWNKNPSLGNIELAEEEECGK